MRCWHAPPTFTSRALKPSELESELVEVKGIEDSFCLLQLPCEAANSPLEFGNETAIEWIGINSIPTKKACGSIIAIIFLSCN